jgi:hypothetical protein
MQAAPAEQLALVAEPQPRRVAAAIAISANRYRGIRTPP